VYLAMSVLSTIVATVGLDHNSVAIIIGAMVIAPLLGPNMALSLATTLGDLTLLRRAVLTVKIPLTDILLSNRRKAVEQGLRPRAEKMLMKGFRLASSGRVGYNMPGLLKDGATFPLNYMGWGPKRSMPGFAGTSFSQQYKKKNKK
jgi:hypothetical protein